MPDRQETAAFFKDAQTVEKHVKVVLDPIGWLVDLAVGALKWWNRTQYGHPKDFAALSRIFTKAAADLELEAGELSRIAARTDAVWQDHAGDAARRRIRAAEEKLRERSRTFSDIAETADVMYEVILIVEDIAYAVITEVLKRLATKKLDAEAKKQWAVIEAAGELPPLIARLTSLLFKLSGAAEKIKPVVERLAALAV